MLIFKTLFGFSKMDKKNVQNRKPKRTFFQGTNPFGIRTLPLFLVFIRKPHKKRDRYKYLAPPFPKVKTK